ncbi:hypothetical protein EZS27_027457 [termite gut metagenome]|uniref:Uncharacterized protein n=1 Tax=termite gut metagenome TaxID=433724 RepID=A0A5J4QQD9_9ZZZZ
MNNRLTILMESRIHGDVYVRFGGEHSETCCRERQQGAECLAYTRKDEQVLTFQPLELDALADSFIYIVLQYCLS